MPNIEIKARCSNLEEKAELAKILSTETLGELHQVDTYFETKQGRMKLREFEDRPAQLIPYFKDYSKGPMRSRYSLLAVEDPTLLKSLMSELLGIIAVVDKKREVFLIGNIRVHLDRVKDLGEFIEFEAVYEEDTQENRQIETTKIQELMQKFQVKQSDLLDQSYVDYLLERG